MNHKHHQDCQKLLDRLNAYIDGDLETELCQQIEVHLDCCPDCSIILSTLEKTIELCQQDSQNTQLPDDVRQRLYQCLDLELYADQQR